MGIFMIETTVIGMVPSKAVRSMGARPFVFGTRRPPRRSVIRLESIEEQVRHAQAAWPAFDAEQIHAILEIQRQETVPIDVVQNLARPARSVQDIVTPEQWTKRQKLRLKRLSQGVATGVIYNTHEKSWQTRFTSPSFKASRNCFSFQTCLVVHNKFESTHVPREFQVIYPLNMGFRGVAR